MAGHKYDNMASGLRGGAGGCLAEGEISGGRVGDAIDSPPGLSLGHSDPREIVPISRFGLWVSKTFLSSSTFKHFALD